jgi:hypothetical protein
MGFGDELAGAWAAQGTIPVPKLQASQHPKLNAPGITAEARWRAPLQSHP